MTDSTPQLNELDALLAFMVDGELQEAQQRRLVELLKANERARVRFVRSRIFDQIIRDQIVGSSAFGREETTQPKGVVSLCDALEQFAVHADQTDSADLLCEMIDQEREAREKRESMQREAKEQQQAELKEHRRLQRLILGQAEPIPVARNYVIPKAVFYGAIATVAAMLIMLVLPMFESKPIIITPIETAPQLVQVATLIEQVDAKWLGQHNAITPGDVLLNQKMHLTAGLAKIRFNSEAEVILEAPCTIEPISESEIKITHGKLVGRCETTNSRGFVVQTPNARIVDLGTEFGVDVTPQGKTEAHVFLGRVAVSAIHDQSVSRSREFHAGTAASINIGSLNVSEVKVEGRRFARSTPYFSQLYRNLIINGDFEADEPGQALGGATVENVTITGWEDRTPATVLAYQQASPYGFPNPVLDVLPSNHGRAFFVGGDNLMITQEIDLAVLADKPTAVNLEYVLSGWLGGLNTQDDEVVLTVIFLDGAGDELQRAAIGPVTASDRNHETGMRYAENIGQLPRKTRRVRLELKSIFITGGLGDGYADNLSLILRSAETGG